MGITGTATYYRSPLSPLSPAVLASAAIAFRSTSSSPSGVPDRSKRAWKRRRRKEAVQGSGVTFGRVPRFACLGPLACAWGFRRRFMAASMKRPALGGRGQEDWNNGTMEYWNDGLGDRPPSPVFQHSSIPSFHWSAGGIRLRAVSWGEFRGQLTYLGPELSRRGEFLRHFQV